MCKRVFELQEFLKFTENTNDQMILKVLACVRFLLFSYFVRCPGGYAYSGQLYNAVDFLRTEKLISTNASMTFICARFRHTSVNWIRMSQ